MSKALPARGIAVATLLVALAGLSLPALAQVNKCAQADGSITYQSAPCGANEPAAARVTAAQLNAAQRARDQAQARAKAAPESHASGASSHARATAASRCRSTPASPPSKAASGAARSPSKPC